MTKELCEGARQSPRKHGMEKHQKPLPMRGQPSLLDRVSEVIRRLRLQGPDRAGSVDGIRRFMLFRGEWHPEAMGAVERERRFWTDLAVKSNVPSIRNHAPNAIVFLYRQISRGGSGRLRGIRRAKERANP